MNTRQNYDRQLSGVLHVIASHTDAESCIDFILQTALEAFGTTGAAFRSDFYPGLNRSAGETVDVDPAAAHANGSADAAAGILALPIQAGDDRVGVLTLALPSMPDDRHLLDALVDGLTLVLVRERSQNAAGKSRLVHQSVLTAVPDPVLIFDADWRLWSANPAAEALFGYVEGKTLAEIAQSDELVAFAQGGKPLAEWGKSGKTYLPICQPIGDAPDGWTLVLRDISRIKKLNQNQHEFIQVVSHDIRSPLTTIRGFTEMMSAIGEFNDKQKYYADKVQSGITQITALVDNIQDAGRFDVETGFYVMNRSPVEMREMVTRIARSQLIPSDKPELSISSSVADDVPLINADKLMLERAVTNLVDNAVKYTPNGGKIEALACVRDGSVVVSVRDNGPGISPENQKLLFQRHVRLPRKDRRRISGSGLGLFIVKSVAQRHGGDAWVESVENVGSTFSFNIPLKGANLIKPGDVG